MTFRYDAVQLFDLDFGPRLIPVTPPGCDIKPGAKLLPKDRGKAPGVLTHDGWIETSVYRHGCPDYATAKLWRDEWGSNVGFVAGDGYLFFDNDQGREFSAVLMALLNRPLRRYVMDPKHERDAFLVRVLDFVGDGASVANRELKFRNGTRVATLSILAKGKQAVISGVHPGTGAPYAWSRELAGLDQVPTLSEEQFETTIRNLIIELNALGWTLDRPRPVSAPVSAPRAAIAGVNNSGSNATPRIGHNNPPFSDRLAEAKSWLDQIPNRDTPPNTTRTPADEWLDDYTNWVSIAYALIAFLGAALAATPEARDLWITWSDERGQPGQTSESVWDSALAQPSRFGDIGLVKIVRSLVKPVADFPDIDPNDEMLAEATKTPLWDDLRARWAYCKRQSGFVDMRTGSIVSRQAFTDGYANIARALKIELQPGRKIQPNAASLCLEQRDRVEVFDVTYAPGEPPLCPSLDPVLPSFNRWKATTALAAPVDPAQIAPWLKHVEIVLGTGEVQRFLRWCAFAAQHPELKPNWHYMVISLQGLGKDTLVAPLKLAVGDGNWVELLSFGLAKSFDYALERKLLIVGETSQPRSGFVNAHDFNTLLKPLLAQPPTHLTVNLKFRAPYEIPNRCALIMFSNDPHPLVLERGQRRVHVVNRLAEANQSIDYYNDLHHWLKTGGDALVASYLLNYTLSDVDLREFVGGVAPDTDDKTELESQSVHPQLAALEELIADARAGIKDNTPWTLVATVDDLSQMIKDKGSPQRPSALNVRTWLLDMERRKTGVRRLRVDPKEPGHCGVVNVRIQGVQHGARLWLLSDMTSDGRPWNALTNAEIMAIWRNLPPPANATVIRHPKSAFPDDAEEEPV